MSLQRTLALIKPDAVGKADEIVEMALQAGFTVLEVRPPVSRCSFSTCYTTFLHCLVVVSCQILFLSCCGEG